MRLPTFLVIGAMKCGTTTLYRDLIASPAVHIPDKELNFLTLADADLPGAADAYARLFRQARPGQACGDVSTTYSMLPLHQGVADRARRLLGPTVKIVYLVREPISRATSHHAHMHCWHGPGRMCPDVDASVRSERSLVDYGRYMTQLGPWRRAFGDEAIHVVVLEEYAADRQGALSNLWSFLRLPGEAPAVNATVVHNAGDGKPITNALWRALRDSTLYQRVLRPTISPAMRDRIRRLLLPTAPPRPRAPSSATVDFILRELAPEAQALAAYLGRSQPIWDLDAVRRQVAERQRSAA
jgi:hypothetical protein